MGNFHVEIGRELYQYIYSYIHTYFYIIYMEKAVWSIDGLILTTEDRNTHRKNSPNITLSITTPTWIELRSNPILRSEGPATGRLNMAGPCAGFSKRDWDYFTLS
jgi:hypothetical protein